MNDERATNGQRAALAMGAVGHYAQSSPARHPAEMTFFFDHERDALPGGDQDRLSRPGRPAEYLVDFITSREWLREPDLVPAPSFPAVATARGTFSSAYVARHVLDQIVHAVENAYYDGLPPNPDAVRDLDAIPTALSGWSGIGRGTLLQSFSKLVTDNDGQLIAGALTSHPVTLSAASAPVPPGATRPGSTVAPAASSAAVLPFRKPGLHTQAGLR